MKKLFKDWKPFEIGLLVFDIIAIAISSAIGKSGILTILTSLTGVICVLLQAKGKIVSQLVGILEAILYSILSYPILSKPLLWGNYYLWISRISHVYLWSHFLGNT